MKLIKVEYLEESSKAIFFDVTFKTTSFFGKVKTETKRAYLEYSKYGYNGYFSWSDNTGWFNTDNAIVAEMILQYEKTCNTINA